MISLGEYLPEPLYALLLATYLLNFYSMEPRKLDILLFFSYVLGSAGLYS